MLPRYHTARYDVSFVFSFQIVSIKLFLVPSATMDTSLVSEAAKRALEGRDTKAGEAIDARAFADRT